MTSLAKLILIIDALVAAGFGLLLIALPGAGQNDLLTIATLAYPFVTSALFIFATYSLHTGYKYRVRTWSPVLCIVSISALYVLKFSGADLFLVMNIIALLAILFSPSVEAVTDA